MHKLIAAIKANLIWGIVVAVLFVAGIPLIVFSVMNELWLLFAVGIVFVLIGFYGSPFVWIAYGTKKEYLRMVNCVLNNSPANVGEVADIMKMSKEQTTKKLRYCFDRNFIDGFFMTSDGLIYNQKKPPNIKPEKVTVKKCEGCGARVLIGEDEEQAFCPYCDCPVEK